VRRSLAGVPHACRFSSAAIADVMMKLLRQTNVRVEAAGQVTVPVQT